MARARQAEKDKQRRRDNFQRWLLFVAIVSVFPVLTSVLWNIMHSRPLNWVDVFGKGELLTASFALAAEAAGGGIGRTLHDWKLLLAGISVIMAFLMAGLVSTAAADPGSISAENMANYSVGFFVTSLTIALGMKAAVED